MLIFILILTLIAIIFSKEIKAGCGLFILCAISLALWDFWWGKIVVIAFMILMIVGVIGMIIEKYQNSSFATWVKNRKGNGSDKGNETYYIEESHNYHPKE